ncbi:G patch domain-containing protein 1-like [Patiria miniata]|uniref:G-patch domain-containing protein n=1 Tax=Patiria miniata TaxID=46514 RepID=A0A914AW22_PATMI|nr:G patch domain-containing protein 1-like [Patiria miniata]
MADDSDDDFVSYGTALEPIENDEARRKPVLLEDQVVTDKQGRRRFHGAFTGGFSAGYFNSVGTKEGWTPSTFMSSRGQKTGGQSRQRAEDFMDEEDLGDFGIAPRKIVTTEKFTGEGKPQKRLAPSSGPSAIPGEHPLQDLIVMSNESIGGWLLRKMGWRQGQGVGPKVRRRKKKSAPSDLDVKASDNDDGEDDDPFKDFLFAPTDVEEIALHPKDDYHGIGYRGLDPSMAGMGGHVALFEEQPVYSRSGRRGIAGQGFGVGAFETADDNIYGVDSMSNYDTVLGGEEPGDSNYGWTAPRGHDKASRGVLENFKVSAQARPPNKIFPPPLLPKDFRPFHTVDKFAKENRPPQAATEFKSSRFTLSALQRAAILGEEQLPDSKGQSSVFDFLSVEDREKLKSSSSSTQDATPSHPRGQQIQEPTQSRFHRAPSPAPAAPAASDPQRLQAFGGGFQPFANDAAKQQRYEEYLARKGSGKDSDVAPPASNMTEWERQREAEEFVRASALYRPLSSMMATRFVTAKHKDEEETVDVPAEEGGDKSDQAKAADLKMFGKLTRDTLEWHPDSLLSKRFNLPNPYPGSSVVGLPTVKKDKFSVFNFLSIAPAADDATAPSSSASELVGSQQLKDKASRWDKRPALLANVGVSREEDGAASSQTQVDPQAADEAETESRPPMDLFKAIFADSSSSSSEEDEREGAEQEAIEGGKETPNKQEPNHSDDGHVRSPHPSGMESAEKQPPFGIPTASNGLESPQTTARNRSGVQTPPMNSESESEEVYGPRLPPPSSSAANQSTGNRGQGSEGLPRDTSEHRRSKSHRKEKRRKKHEGRSSSRHKTSKDKKKSKKKKKMKKKETKVRHKGHHRSSSRSDRQGQHRTVPDADYDASGSSSSGSSSEDSN